MLLSEFFTYLSHGPLSQVALGTENNGAIAEKDYPKLISYINLGLIKAYTRLPIKMDNVVLKVTCDQDTYKLHSSFAVSTLPVGQANYDRYLLDKSNPFTDSLIKIEEVESQEGHCFTLNDSEDDNTVYTPSFNTLQFNQPKDMLVSVSYRSKHKSIPMSRATNPTEVELEIPDYLVEPLMTFCISQLLGNLANSESIQESAMLKQKFDIELKEIENQGLAQIDTTTSNRIWSDRWV